MGVGWTLVCEGRRVRLKKGKEAENLFKTCSVRAVEKKFAMPENVKVTKSMISGSQSDFSCRRFFTMTKSFFESKKNNTKHSWTRFKKEKSNLDSRLTS